MFEHIWTLFTFLLSCCHSQKGHDAEKAETYVNEAEWKKRPFRTFHRTEDSATNKRWTKAGATFQNTDNDQLNIVESWVTIIYSSSYNN